MIMGELELRFLKIRKKKENGQKWAKNNHK
jgi:hypothetical protein